MIRHDPGSYSKIAKASHIVDVVLQGCTASPWRPDEQLALDKRDVRATLRVERIWKGDPLLQGEAVQTRFTQYAYREATGFVLPGVWSRHTLLEGERYFLFSNASLPSILQEPQLFFVETGSAAALDVDLTNRSGCPPKRLGAVLADAEPELPRLGVLFSEYVASRIPEMFFNYPADYHRFFRMLESDAAPRHLRAIWLRDVSSWLSMMDPAPPVFLARTVFGFMRVASVGGTEIRQTILGTYLPNLLGITGGLTRKSSPNVFAAFPVALQQSVEILRAHPELPNQRLLLEWFQAS